MFEKAKAFYGVFTAGQSAYNAIFLKKAQLTGGLIASLLAALIAVAKVFGHDIPLTDAQLLQIGGAFVAVFGLFNAGATVASTDKLGLPPKREPNEAGSPAVDAALPAVPADPAPAPVQPQYPALTGVDSTYFGG